MTDLPFKIGDIVTRDGTDLHRIVDMNGDGGDLIEVECIKEPLGFLNDDGTRREPWARLGEREWNLARRYDHAGDLIEGARGGIVRMPDLQPLPEGVVGFLPGGRPVSDGEWFDQKMAELPGPTITIMMGRKG